MITFKEFNQDRIITDMISKKLIVTYFFFFGIKSLIMIMQIMTKVYILSCFMPFLAYRDKKRANGTISLSLYPRKAIKQDKIDTEVIIREVN